MNVLASYLLDAYKEQGDEQMSCGLEDYELDILDTLFSRRCFNSDSSLILRGITKDIKEDLRKK